METPLTHWTDPDHLVEPIKPPSQTRLEPAWRAVSPTGKVLDCSLYEGAVAGRVEVRAQYPPDVLIRSELANSLMAARQIAATWRAAAFAKGFVLPPGDG